MRMTRGSVRLAMILLIALLTPAIGVAMPATYPKAATTEPLVMVGTPPPTAPVFIAKMATTQPLVMVGTPAPPPAPPFAPKAVTTEALTMIGIPEGEKP